MLIKKFDRLKIELEVNQLELEGDVHYLQEDFVAAANSYIKSNLKRLDVNAVFIFSSFSLPKLTESLSKMESISTVQISDLDKLCQKIREERVEGFLEKELLSLESVYKKIPKRNILDFLNKDVSPTRAVAGRRALFSFKPIDFPPYSGDKKES